MEEEKTKIEPCEQEEEARESEHILRLWEPFSYTVDADYDYLREGLLVRAHTRFWRTLCTGVIWVVNKAFLGFRVEGRERLKSLRGQGVVSICNHVHPMDCTMVDNALFSRRMYYLTLATNFRIPVARHLIHLFGGVPTPTNLHGMARMNSVLAAALQNGACVQIYPEGVLRPYETRLHPFFDGAFHLAVQAQAPVLPLRITARAPRGIYRLYKRRPCLTLEILEPVYAAEHLSRREAQADLKARCRAAMEAAPSAASAD